MLVYYDIYGLDAYTCTLGSIVLDIDACVHQRLNFLYLLFYFIDISLLIYRMVEFAKFLVSNSFG